MNKLWSKVIRKLWGGRCAKCRRRGRHDSHHLIKRRANGSVYIWNPQNGIYLCRPCHGWAEANDKRFFDWLRFTWPKAWTWWNVHHENKRFRYVNRDREEKHLIQILERQGE